MNKDFNSFCASIHFVIVTFNGENYIRKCIQCLKESAPESTVHIIDNLSTDNTISILEELDQKPIRLNKNLGFGQANNIGINHARKQNAEYVFLLNQDAYIDTNAIKNIFAKGQPSSTHIHTLLQMTGDGHRLDQNFRSTYLTPDYCPNFLEDAFLGQLKSTYPIRFSNAAAWLLPINVIETVGGFNPSFFHYGEDDNYVHRSRYHGIQCLLHTNSLVYHDREERGENQYFNDSQQKKRLFLIQSSHPENKNKLKKVKKQLRINLLKKILRGTSKQHCIESLQLEVLSKSKASEIEKNRVTSRSTGASFL